MASRSYNARKTSTAYNLFILVLTALSLVIMVVLFLPLYPPTIMLLRTYDNLICAFFIIDFLLNLRLAPNKSDFFFRQRGWLDLVGSIPSFGMFRYTGLLRLARLSRVERVYRRLRAEDQKPLLVDVLENRSQYAGFITILMAILVMTTASVLVLQFEFLAPNANIKNGSDAIWYSIVTITTVGYGDKYPVTSGGRITGAFIMATGVGIIGALASLLSSFLLGSSKKVEPEAPGENPAPALERDIAEIKEKLANGTDLNDIKAQIAALAQMLEEIQAKEKGLNPLQNQEEP